MLRRLIGTAAVALFVLAPAAPALASGDAVIKDCVRNGRLTKQYSQKDYRDALANMPTDVDEYTDCRDIIRHAQLGFAGGSGGSSGGSGGGSSTPSGGAPGTAPNPFAGASASAVARAKREIARARAGALQRRLGADVVTPGALSYRNISALSKLPTSLLILSILITLAALGAGAYLATARVRARKHGP
jgi:hypothetical protein